MIIRILLAWLMLLTVQVTCAQPSTDQDDHITSREYFADPQGFLGIDEIQGKTFSAVGPILSRGYTHDTHWLRLRIRPAVGGELLLRIIPTYLDELTLYLPDPERPGKWRIQRSGDRVPWANHQQMGIVHGFDIPAQYEITCYLSLKTSSTSLLKVEALLPQVAELSDLKMYFWQWLFLSVMLMALIWAIFDYIVNREQVVAWFILAQATYLVYSFLILGYVAPLVPNENWADIGTSLSVCLITTTTLMFHHQLLATFQPPTWLLRTLKLTILASVINFMALLMTDALTGLFWNSVLALFGSLVFLPLALLATKNVPPGLRTMRIYYGVLTASVFIVLMPIVGLYKASEINLYGALIHGLMAAGIKVGLLIQRSRAIQQQGTRTKLNLAVAEHQLGFERQRLDDQQRFVAMLTHELKTPLAIVRLSIDSMQVRGNAVDRIARSLNDMDRIVDRCRQIDQFEHKALASEWREVSLTQLADEVIDTCHQMKRIRCVKSSTESMLTSDPLLLGIVLSNLLDNALKYSAEGSMVQMAISDQVSGDGRHGYVVYVDNEVGAVGIPDKLRIFEKYYRSPTAHGKIGSGLGLYLARGIAQQLGGTLEYDFDSQRIRFIFWIPSCK
jgi:two-component system, sensor histidine kinase LadS